MKEALKLALEALSSGEKMKADGIGWWEYDSRLVKQAITAAKEALAQPAQEPVAWIGDDGNLYHDYEKPHEDYGPEPTPLYTTPQQRPWVGLTVEERNECVNTPFTADQWANIETKLKEKNT